MLVPRVYRAPATAGESDALATVEGWPDPSPPSPPRVSPPDLPARLDDRGGLRPRSDAFQTRVSGLDEVTDAAHSALTECVLDGVSAQRLDLTGANLVDVDFAEPRADEVDTRGLRAEHLDLRGLRAEHLDLRGLDAAAYLDPAALRGATLTPWQVEQLASAFAVALGVDVRD
ncbi:hypothetical protein AB1K54_09885 [Microbacterium sp. BWT-B31]|uniref:hypothetical protein n=1 Tax=Microbacterium sp. BWT-B31 TaxID=3232072 RepID=UPI0035287734